MLYSDLAVADKYNYLSERLQRAYQWLQTTDLTALAVGRHEIEGDIIFASVMEYVTKPVEAGRFEAHEKYFDIQYVVAGEERFGICKAEGLTVSEYVPEKDLIFFESPQSSGYVVLKPGDIAVAAPEDAHMPMCCLHTPCNVKKVVVKVAVDAAQ